VGAGNLAQVLKLIQILLNEYLAHVEVARVIGRNIAQNEKSGEAVRLTVVPQFDLK